MNSKIIFIIFSLMIYGCGLKTKPIAPQATKLPSLTDEYSKKFHLKDKSKKQKSKK